MTTIRHPAGRFYGAALIATCGLWPSQPVTGEPPAAAPSSQPVVLKPVTSRPSTADGIAEARKKALESIARQRAAQAGTPDAAPGKPANGPAATPLKPNRPATPHADPAAAHAPPPAAGMPPANLHQSNPPRRAITPLSPPPGQQPVAPPSQQPPASPATPPAASPTQAPTSAPAQGTNTTLMFVTAPIDPDAKSYRFDYQNTPWTEVLADFARMSGLSFINQPDPPIADSLSFRSPGTMTYKEALHQLNELLLERPLNRYLIQRQGNFLTINRLPDLMRKIPPDRMFNSFDAMERAKPNEHDVVLVYFDVPKGWNGYEIIENFRPYCSDTYGTQVVGDRIELTGLVQEHRRFRDVVSTLTGMVGDPKKNDPRMNVTVRLKNARCSDVQNILRQIYPMQMPGMAPGRGPGPDQNAETAKRIDIITEMRTNALILKAPAKAMTELLELIEKLDAGTGPAASQIKVVKLEHADATMLANTLNQVFAREQQSKMSDPQRYVSQEERAAGDRTLFPDVATNSILIFGSAQGVESAEKLVREWDRPDESQVTQVLELKHAEAAVLANTLMTMFPPMGRPGQVPTRITPRSAKSILLSGNRKEVEKIRDLAEKLDLPAEGENKEHVVRLKSCVPSMLSNMLQQAAPGIVPQKAAMPNRPGMPPGPMGTSMRFLPDDASGLLIVYCTEEEWEKLGPLITRLDEEALAADATLHSFKLTRASPADVANMLRSMFPAAGPAPGKAAAQAQAQFFPDDFNGTLNVWGSREFINKIEPLISRLDIETDAPLTVIKLVHAKADVIAPILSASITGKSAAPGMPGMPQMGGQMPGRPAGGGVRITPEPITNALLISAPAKELEQIKQLVAEMEAKESEREIARVILEAKFRPAPELADTLRGLATAAPQRMGQPGMPQAPSRSDKGLTIVPAGQQLILDGPRDEVAKCVQLFQQLDVPYEQPIFRKYAVQDAEEDEQKLRAMLALTPAVKSSPSTPGQPRPAAPPIRLIAPDAIQIYADTAENVLLVGAKVEEDLKTVEGLLAIIFSDPRKVETGKPQEEEGTRLPFFTIKLRYRDAYDVAWDVEKLVNPDDKKNGINLSEGPSKKILLVKNCKPAQRKMLEEVLAMYDVPEGRIGSKNRRIIDAKMNPVQLARMLQKNYVSETGAKLKVLGPDDLGAVQVVDIHAGEPAGQPATQPAEISPCVLPASLLAGLSVLAPAQAPPASPLPHPKDCPICAQMPCVPPGHLTTSLAALATLSFDDPLDGEPPKDDETTKPEEHNHATTERELGAISPNVAEAMLGGTDVQIIPDPETGKMIMVGPEDELDAIEDMIDELTSGDTPPVVRVFPLRYAEVTPAAQLLEQIFNQGGAGSRGKQKQQTMIPMQLPQAQQPGKPQVPGQPQPPQPQQPQQVPQPQQVAVGRIKVVPESRTRSLFVVAPPQDIPLIIEVLRTIDSRVPPGASDMRMFEMENLDANAVVDDLRVILGLDQGRGRGFQAPGQPGQPGQPQPQAQMIQMAGQPGAPGQPGAVVNPADNIKLTAEEQTNTVIATGPKETLDLIESIITDLKKRNNTTKPEMRRVELAHARASDVATIVKDVANASSNAGGPGGGGGGGGGGRRRTGMGQVSINADSRTNAIILAGAVKDLDRVEEIVRKMDIKEASSGIQQFPVKGDANSIVTALKAIFVPSGREADVVITADPSTGTVLVKAPGPQMEEIRRQIASLDEKVAESKDLRTIKLNVADAESIAPKIQEIFASSKGARGGKQEITVKGNKSSGMLYVSGADAETYERIQRVAKDMDTQKLIQVRTFPLKHASAVDVNQKLTEMMTKAAVTGGLGDTKLDLVGVVPDARTNSLIVTGGPITFILIPEVLKAVDQEPTEMAARTTKVYSLPQAVDSAEIVRNIADIFKDETVQKTGMEPPAVTANADAGIVSVVATAAQHEKIAHSVIEPVTKAVTGTGVPETRFIRLANSKAEDLAKALTEAVKAKMQPNKRGQYPVTITADMASNNLIVTARSDMFAEIEAMVKALDQEGGRTVHTVTMPELVPAKSVAENINKLFASGGGAPGGAGGREGINADYHEPTNTLLVRATDAEFAKIKEQVIDVVSKTPPSGVLKIFKIPLKYAVADEVAKTLQAFFDKKSGIKSQQNNLPPWMRGGEPPAKALDNQVSITAEPSSNTLLVYCTDATKEVIDGIVKDIDVDPSGKSVMEMVALKYVDAEEMLAILTEYLKVSKRSTEGENQPFVPWWFDGRQEQKEDKAVLAGDMRLKAVESMNALILVGKPESVADAKKKIAELDVEQTEGSDVPQRIVLKHANASEIATTMDKIFNDPKRAAKGASSYKPPVIVAEDSTNSLIVRARQTDYMLIRKMAEGFDEEMKDDSGGGVRIVQVPAGRSAEELARLVEQQINEGEQHKKQVVTNYKPSLVKIGADTRSNALLVTGSKAKYEEVERIVKNLVAMGPAGGSETRIIKLRNLSTDQAKKLIEQLQEQQRGGKPGGSPRSDATWRRSERMNHSIPVGSRSEWHGGWHGLAAGEAVANAEYSRHRPEAQSTSTAANGVPAGRASSRGVASAGIPLMALHLALASAIAQAPPPAGRASVPPVQTATIRPRAAATQPAAKPDADVAERLRAATAPGGQMSDSARQAFGKKLSGQDISAVEAGHDGIILNGAGADLDVIEAVLGMMDQSIGTKKIEYVPLKNASAKELAKTLSDVFSKLEKIGDKPARPEDKVDVIADTRTNGLFIAATEDKMKQALDLVRQNELAAPNIERNVKNFILKNRRATEAGEIVKKMVSAYLKQKGVTDPSQIGIEIDPQTNTIFVTAGESDLQFVEKVITGIDAELPETKEGEKQPIGEADVMIVPLRITQADQLALLINELLKKAATGDTPMKDFIRRFRLLDEKGEPLATVNLDRPIVVFADKDSNALVIASTKSNCLIMKQVAMAFDKEPARAEVVHRVFNLKYAECSEVAENLKKMLTDGESLTQRPGKGDKSGIPDGEAGALVYKAVVSAEPRTNQLFIVGRPDAMKLLSELVEKMDVKGLDVMPFEIVKLTYASAGGLETALTDLMKERKEALPKGTGPNAGKSETVIIKSDARSRSLIISANASRREELKGLIAKLDVPATALIEDIRTITLKKSSAADLADKLKKLWEDRQKQQSEGAKGGLKLEIPAIVADERSNSLVVAASKGDFDAIKAVVDKIEALELNPMANIYIVRLKYNSAKQLSTAMKTLFEKRAEMRTVDGKSRPEDKVAMEVDETTNAILFAGSRENHELLEQKVRELDEEAAAPGVIEFFVCDNVGAGRVKSTIDEMFKESGIYRPGAADSELAKKRNKVTVTLDERANILIVSASPENMNIIREIYKRMNSVVTPWDAAITKIVTIEHGDCVKIAAQMADYFKKLDEVREKSTGSDKGKGGGFGVTVFADDRSNRIVIGGTKDGIDSAVDLVKRLDVPPGTPGQVMEVYRLHEASASTIGEMVKKIFEQRNKPRGGGETGAKVDPIAVSVEIEASTNSILVNAAREDQSLIKELIERLDRPSTVLEMARIIPLEKAPADKVKEILEELYSSSGGGGKGASGSSGSGSGGGSGGRAIAVMADNRTNSVIVTAPPGELENIITLVSRLDQIEVKGAAEVGVFPCENEDAKKMAELLSAIMTGQGGPEGSTTGGGAGGGSSRSSSSSGAESDKAREIQSMLISFASTDPQGREVFLKTIRENVQITFTERTNSVIAVAPPASLRLIRQLITKLDQIQKRAVLVRVFMLRNADATKMVDLLERMFAAEEGQEEERDFQRGREIQVEGGASQASGAPSAISQIGETQKGTFGRPKTTFVADERTNSLIIAGWPEDIDVVADVLDQLDSKPIQDRENVVVTLTNATAEDVEAALSTYFEAETARLDSLGDTISPQQRMDQEVSIVPHPESNQLIVSASPRYKNRVLTLVEQLDLPPPQVMIQVMIAEVLIDDRFEMGVEFALQNLRFSETAVPDANGILQSDHYDVVAGTDLGAAGVGLSGFSFTITGEDFDFLLRAFQSDSRLEVIQRPMIMCQDNQPANITIGQSVPIPTGSQAFAGQTSTQVQYQDVGVLLSVEPHINPDGFVYMLVEPEISSVTDSTIQIAPGAFAPVLNRRNASTNVAVRDGETVVIGGLITTTDREAEAKVPFLGDIPGLGLLFRTTVRTKNKAELLIALTPRVVRTVEDARRISIASRDESGIITDQMKQSPLFGKLQIQPESPDELIGPEEAEPAEGTGAPVEGATDWEPSDVPPAPAGDQDRPKYGPQAPRYGPLVPAGTQVSALPEE